MGQTESTTNAPVSTLALVRGEGGADFVGLDNLGNTCYCNRCLQALQPSPPHSHPPPCSLCPNAFQIRICMLSRTCISPCSVLQLLHCSTTFRSACLRWADDMEARLLGAPSNHLPPSFLQSLLFHLLLPSYFVGSPPPPQLEESLLWMMALIFRHMQPRKGKALVRRMSPSKFIALLKRKHQQFDGTQQQDAHELFSALLNACDDEAKLLFELPPNQPTFIQDVFQGELSSEIRCLTCERVSYRRETFVDLSLDVEHCCSVSQCLQSFTAVETMNGSNKFMCEACNGLQEAHRRSRVRRWPRCLLLQLKRFKVVENGGTYYNKKLNARVEFMRELRLTGVSSADDEDDAGSYRASAAGNSDMM
jgi:uncharacterized UBP type Zn finger protein